VKNCSYCGRENTDEAVHCKECGTEFAAEPPAASSPRSKSPSAGFGIRLLARLIDAALGMLLGFTAGIVGIVIIKLLSALSIVHPGWQYRLHNSGMISLEVIFVGTVAYHYLCEGIHGSTLGKFCCGIRVVSEDGKPATFRGALIRTIAYYFDGFFFGLVGYSSMSASPLNQRYGDRWGKTMVVRVAELPPESQNERPAHFALGLLAGLACWFGMLVFGVILKAF
jgi:uncharacterized RDD family membrane protein YckC